MTTKYYALLTTTGAGKLANAAALGTQLKITQMAVGDGGGTLPTPNASQTKLIGEWRRAALNSLTVDTANSSQIIAEQVIPENEGGFWIREIGLYDADGALIAVANCPETYKPQLQEGSGRTQTVRMILIVNSTDAVTLKVDPSVVLATRKYVDDAVIEVKAYADSLMDAHLKAADPHSQYAPKASPTFTGTPKAPTPAASNNSTQLATTAFVQALLKAHLDAADPHTQYLETANYLSELAGLNDTTRKILLGNLGAIGKAFSMETGITRLDDSSVTAKTQFLSISGTMEDGPLGAVGYTATLLNIRRVWDAGTSLTQIMFQSGMMYIRTAQGGEGNFNFFTGTTVNANGWRKIYDEGFKPTPQEIGALPYSTGGLGSTNLNTLNQEKVGIYFQGLSTLSIASNGYPKGATAGTLEVLPSSGSKGVIQRYTNLWGGASWVRATVGAWNGSDGPWSDWHPTLTAEGLLSEIKELGASAQQSAVGNLGIAGNLVPVGIPMPWPTNTAPDGWIKCNGASFSATAYPQLAKVYPALKVPDLRGEFIRGFDDGRGVDSGRGIGTSQAATQLRTAMTDYGGADAVTDSWAGMAYAGEDAKNLYNSSIPAGAKAPDGSALNAVTWDNTIKATQDGAALSSAGSPWISVRPRNVAFNFIVRAA